MEEIDYQYVDYPTCPYCGYEIIDDYNEYFSDFEEETEIECPECQKIYGCYGNMTVCFTSISLGMKRLNPLPLRNLQT